MLPGIRAELEALRRRHSSALELMGERDEEVHSFSIYCCLLKCQVANEKFISVLIQCFQLGEVMTLGLLNLST